MRLLTVQEGSELLRIKPARAYQLIRENAFPPGVIVRIGEKQLRFSEEGLREWITKGGSESNLPESEVSDGR